MLQDRGNKLKEAKIKGTKHVLAYNGVCGLVAISTSVAVSIIKIVLGLLHIHDCPMEPLIPVYMILTGTISMLMVVTSVCLYTASTNQKITLIVIILLLTVSQAILLVWNIIGSCWIFKKEKGWEAISGVKEIGCDMSTYLCALVLQIIYWICFPCFLADNIRTVRVLHSKALMEV